MKLWMITEIPGEPADAPAFVWADDPDEARWLLREKTGKHGRVCVEMLSAKGVAVLPGGSHHEQHWEVAVQADPGGSFFVLTDPQERYPDAQSAAEQARQIEGHFHCVRVHRVLTDWYVPDELAGEAAGR